MKVEDVVTLIASVIAFITSVITIIISIWHQNLYDKKHRRVVPGVSLLNQTDGIFARIENEDNARIFIDIRNELKNIKEVNLCICLKNFDQFKINNCIVRVFVDGVLIVKKNIGTVTDKRIVFIPAFLKNQNFKKLYCIIDYWTEAEEHLFYEINTQTDFKDRKDEVFLLRKCKAKKRLNVLNSELNISYSPQEVIEKIKENKWWKF